MNTTPTLIFELAAYTAEKYNKPDVLAGKKNNVWKTYSAKEYVNTSDNISYGLLNLGMKIFYLL